MALSLIAMALSATCTPLCVTTWVKRQLALSKAVYVSVLKMMMNRQLGVLLALHLHHHSKLIKTASSYAQRSTFSVDCLKAESKTGLGVSGSFVAASQA